MPTDEPLNPSPETAGTPVFVDASGRRARRIRRLATVVVLGCIGYGMALLIAALTGVPIDGAVVPYPALGGHPHSNRPAEPPRSQPTSPGTISPASGVAGAGTAQASATPTNRPAPTASARPTSGAPHPTGKPTATATHGKATSAPGVTHRPTSKPTVAATSHGRAVRP